MESNPQQRGDSPRERDSQALYEAARYGHASAVFQLVAFSGEKARNSRALVAACNDDHVEVVKHLLPFLSKIQCAQQGFEAAVENNRKEVLEVFLEASLLDPGDTNSSGLNISAEKDYLSMAKACSGYSV